MGFRHGRRRSDAPASAKVARADGSGQKIAVPSYLDPGANPQDWNALIEAQTSKVAVAIANVLNGPTYQRDQQWADVIHRVRASGKRVLGYVDTGCLGRTGLLTRLGSAAAADWIAHSNDAPLAVALEQCGSRETVGRVVVEDATVSNLNGIS